MKITIENYQKYAQRTCPSLGSRAQDGAHMAMGITTELGEMEIAIHNNDSVNFKEEHGDCLWYIANECNIYGFDFKELFQDALEHIEKNKVVFELHDLVDLHKRELAYKKDMDLVALEEHLVRLVAKLYNVAYEFNFDFVDSLQLNIEKLYARFPDKFTQENALNRDLDKERKILENEPKGRYR